MSRLDEIKEILEENCPKESKHRHTIWYYVELDYLISRVEKLEEVARAAEDVVKHIPSERLGNYDEDWMHWLSQALAKLRGEDE